jgi:hypothetical protein
VKPNPVDDSSPLNGSQAPNGDDRDDYTMSAAQAAHWDSLDDPGVLEYLDELERALANQDVAAPEAGELLEPPVQEVNQ